jgi:hypothetical protein
MSDGQPHAARRGQYFGTLIDHARSCALAQLAIAVAVILTPFGRTLVRRTRCAHLRCARWNATALAAVGLSAIAAAANRKQVEATSAPLEAKQQLVVHRSPTAETTSWPATPTPSIVCSQPASIGRGSRAIPGTRVLFGVLTACNPIGAIVDTATILPIDAAMILPSDLNRQNDTGSGCHQQYDGSAAFEASQKLIWLSSSGGRTQRTRGSGDRKLETIKWSVSSAPKNRGHGISEWPMALHREDLPLSRTSADSSAQRPGGGALLQTSEPLEAHCVYASN